MLENTVHQYHNIALHVADFWSSITAFFCPGFVDLVMSMRPEAIMRMLAGMRARTAAEYIITIVTYAPRSFHGVLFQV